MVTAPHDGWLSDLRNRCAYCKSFCPTGISIPASSSNSDTWLVELPKKPVSAVQRRLDSCLYPSKFALSSEPAARRDNVSLPLYCSNDISRTEALNCC